MILRKKLMTKLYKLYPRYLAKKNHDYVGVMVKPSKEEVNNILVCLDLDEAVLNKIPDNIDLIITHHPFLYGRSKVQVLKTDPIKKELYDRLVNMGIGVISMHTNFDEAKGGMNDVLASKLELKNIYAPDEFLMMRIGDLNNELEIDDFISYAKVKLNINYALLQGYGKKTIKKVALIGGGGSHYFKVAYNEGADIYISSDAPHHIRREVTAYKFNYLEVPHEVERVFMQKMKEDLLKIDSSLNITIIDHEKEATVY